MVKPKKPEISVWKTVESKGCHKHQKEKLKPFLGDLPAQSKKQNNDASQQNNQNTQDLLQDSNSIIRIGNRIIFLIQCRFRHIVHLYLCHADFYYSMIYFYLSWHCNSCMPSLPRYLCPDHITYREPTIGKPSMTVLMKKIGLYRKRNKGDQASLSCQKRWTIKQKFRFDTK